ATRFEEAARSPLPEPHALPPGCPLTGPPVRVYVPRPIHLVWVPDQPRVTANGLVADGDAAPLNQGIFALPTPPRTFPLHWYRISPSNALAEIPTRLVHQYSGPGAQ